LGRPLAENEIVHHINRVRTDDRPENLLVITPQQHAAIHAHDDRPNRARGERISISKLTGPQVKDIRRIAAQVGLVRGNGGHARKSLVTLSSLGRRFGVGHAAIANIVDHKTWRHLLDGVA
jgi:hypothetical protein